MQMNEDSYAYSNMISDSGDGGSYEGILKTRRIKNIMGPKLGSRCSRVTSVCLSLLFILLLAVAVHCSSEIECFRIGDRVKVKASVTTPRYEWGSASHKSVGVVTAVTGESMTVDFPEHNAWKATVSEMELVPTNVSVCFRIGDIVKVKNSVSTPVNGWGSASHKSVGIVTAVTGERMTVDFPEHKSWKAAASEMELVPSVERVSFRIGDKVKVKDSVSTPVLGWGSASHKSVGVVTAINGEIMTVDFPEHKSWKAAASEMELVPSVETVSFRIGDKVKVKDSVSTPVLGWGSASRKSVGVVTTINGESMTVDFPEHKSWKAAASEMELVPSVETVSFKVKVKDSVKTPKHGWGLASHRSVGVVTAFDGERMTVDFPEHKGWNAAVSEMEMVP